MSASLTQSQMATLGILKLRGMLSDGVFAATDAEAITALCDYAQAQIEARRRGGRTITDARREANRRNASGARKPKCACGAMTTERATKRNHKCVNR